MHVKQLPAIVADDGGGEDFHAGVIAAGYFRGIMTGRTDKLVEGAHDKSNLARAFADIPVQLRTKFMEAEKRFRI